jgi:hypothetical protein
MQRLFQKDRPSEVAPEAENGRKKMGQRVLEKQRRSTLGAASPRDKRCGKGRGGVFFGF